MIHSNVNIGTLGASVEQIHCGGNQDRKGRLGSRKIWERDAETFGDNLVNSSKERDICISLYFANLFSIVSATSTMLSPSKLTSASASA